MNRNLPRALDSIGAWVLALVWFVPLGYAIWAAFHTAQYATVFDPFAPKTLSNFVNAWNAAPFDRYFLNTLVLVVLILCVQIVVCTLAAFAFARISFRGSNALFALVLAQLLIAPEILMLQNYRTIAAMGLVDTVFAIGFPYFASAFCIFLLRQTFKTIPLELEEAAKLEGLGTLAIIWKVYVPLAMPTYVAFGLVSVSHHWNNFLWPLIITKSVETRPLTVGLQVFSSAEQGIDWGIISAATLMSSAPILIAFIFLQRQFVQSFMRAGIK